jgi:hydrogenase maturation protease
VLADRQRVIVADAIAGDGKPGTVVRLAPEDLVGYSGQAISLHEIGFPETLVLARQLGIAPPEVIIFGVQPREVHSGLELSPEIASLVPEIIRLVLAELGSDASEALKHEHKREG